MRTAARGGAAIVFALSLAAALLAAPRGPAPRAFPDQRLRVNHAAAEGLETLPGIGPAISKRIVEAREAGGAFDGAKELERVGGIGPRTIARIAPYVRFDAEPRGP